MAYSLDPADIGPRDAARLLSSIVVPRPIGWASTVSSHGVRNLAPFSFFNAVENTPPTLMLSIGRRGGRPKDTLRNIQETGEFVVNIADETLAEAITLSSGEYSDDVDEFALTQLTAQPSFKVRPPRVAEAAAALEVVLKQVVPVTETGYTIVVGQVVFMHIREGLLRTNGMVNVAAMKPLARLGGDEFATIGRVFAIPRPT